MGIEEVLSAPRSPWQTPCAERIIGSMRRDCLDHVIIFNDTHLRRVLSCYFRYYHRSKTHRSLNKDCPDPARSNRLELARSSHFPRSVDSVIGTNVARPEPQRSSIARSLRRDPSPSTHCVGQPISGSPVKTAALDFDDHGNQIPRTDKFLSMADCRGRG